MGRVSLKDKLAWRARNAILKRRRAPLLAGSSKKIAVAGLFSTASGIGESARKCADALEKWGCEPIRCDLSYVFGQADLDPMETNAQDLTSADVVILHLNAPETKKALLELGLHRFKRTKVIGYWAWETSYLPESWVSVARYVNEVWVPSRFIAETVAARVDCPVRVCPHTFSAPEIEPPQFQKQSGLHCLCMADGFSSFFRKNILGAIQMFQSAFPQSADAKLTVKTRNLSPSDPVGQQIAEAARRDDRITLNNANLSMVEQRALMQSCDVVLSPHRAEGFGLVIAEAMTMGKVAIATGWSGNMQFMTSENSIPLPYALVPVDDPNAVYPADPDSFWAEPDIAFGASKLRELALDTERRFDIGQMAKATIRNELSPQIWIDAIKDPSTLLSFNV